MPYKQRYFAIVPPPGPVGGPQHRPPMTSKEAKRAYQKATRVPRMSRAESKRLEAEELARQKREHEKGRAAEKARINREKKAAKEKAAEDERKKQGLPQKSKWVRASQPHITGFISGASRKRALGETDDQLDMILETGTESEDEQGPLQKLPRVETEDDFEETEDEAILEEPAHETELPDNVIAAPQVTERSNLALNDSIARSEFVPPSTLAFLQDHLDDFDSDSELDTPPADNLSIQFEDVSTDLDELDGFPSNTQICRELESDLSELDETDSQIKKALPQFTPSQPSTRTIDPPLKTSLQENFNQTPEIQPANVGFDFAFLSSQDLVISSQDLREIDTPCKVQVLQEVKQVKRQPKPRFFEEKEEDLYQAAIYESKLAHATEQGEENKKRAKPTLRPGRKPLQRVLSKISEFGDEGIDEAMLALLDVV